MTKAWRRWLGLLVTAGVAAVALAGCGGDDSDEASGDTKVTGPVSLTVWHTMNEEETPTLEALVDRFEKANPNFDIKLVTVPFAQAQQRFTTAAGAGKGPDVFRAEVAWTPEFAAQGFLADITDRVTDRDEYLEVPFGYNVYEDRVYGIPQVTDSLALLYNKRIFRQAGVEPPTTIEELNAVCEKLGDGKGIFLLASLPGFTLPWIYAYGGDMVDTEAEEVTIDDEPAVQGVQAYTDLFNSDCAFPNDDFANELVNMGTAFNSGRVAMIVTGPFATAGILAGEAFKDPANLGIATFPKGPGGQGTFSGGWNYTISADAENVDAAYQFISELNSADNQALFAERNNLLPTRKVVYQLPPVKDNRILSAFGEQQKLAVSRPVIPEGGQLIAPAGDFATQLQRALTGRADVPDAMQALAEAWTKKLLPDYEVGS